METSESRTGRRLGWLGAIGLLVLLVGGYVAAYLIAGDKVPRGTAVAGIQIGGRDRADAVATLEKGLAARVGKPLKVAIEGGTKGGSQQVEPAKAGLGIDYVKSVEEVAGKRSWAPQELWAYFTGDDTRDAAVSVDDTAMAAEIARLEAAAGTPVKDGRWSFKGGQPKAVAPVVGRGFDDAESKDALAAAYRRALSGKAPEATLELVEIQPAIDAADMQQARTTFVEPAMSGPVTLKFGATDLTWQPKEFAHVLRLTPQDGTLVPGVRPKALEALLAERIGENGKPVDATVRIVGGRPQVVPGKPGVTYDPAEVNTAFLGIVTATGAGRTATIAAKAAQPEFTTEEARALRITEEVSEFTTYWPHSDYRNANIGRAAQRINGTVLKPGETFSLNSIVGERTAANGFTEGYIIKDGLLIKDLGGGVSQSATTTFNAMFFAGLKDIQHKPHSFFIDRYPEGREATVAWPSLDLKFQNDTPYGVLVQAFISPSTSSRSGSITVRMWSTKVWDIRARKSARYDPVPPATRTLTTPDCEEHEGSPGFTVDVWRDFRKPGSSAVVRSERFHTVYKPADHVVCKPPPSPAPAG